MRPRVILVFSRPYLHALILCSTVSQAELLWVQITFLKGMPTPTPPSISPRGKDARDQPAGVCTPAAVLATHLLPTTQTPALQLNPGAYRKELGGLPSSLEEYCPGDKRPGF